MSPRPDDLQERVDELEATVRGLTQELVEATERIRSLEEELDDESAEPPTEPSPESTKPTGTAMETEPEPEIETDSDPESEPATAEDDVDDIIVA